MSKGRFCEECQRLIENDDMYYTDGSIDMCSSCGDECLIYHDGVEAYVFVDEYKDTYYDDELSDVLLFQLID